MKPKGRPKGTNCFVRVSLKDLNKFLKDSAVVSVSKKYLEEIGLTVETPAVTLAPIREAAEEQPKIEFTLTPAN